MAAGFPRVQMLPVCGDFTQSCELPEPRTPARRRVVYFPGSTIGNFPPPERRRMLEAFAELAGPEGVLLLGFDLVKDLNVLHEAYDDPQGVTAAFNLNVLERINRELGGDFRVDRFEHEAAWNPEHQRIEMHLRAKDRQRVTVAGRRFDFAFGETICTEYSHKFTIDGFERELRRCGLTVDRVWTDPRRWFAVASLRPR